MQGSALLAPRVVIVAVSTVSPCLDAVLVSRLVIAIVQGARCPFKLICRASVLSWPSPVTRPLRLPLYELLPPWCSLLPGIGGTRNRSSTKSKQPVQHDAYDASHGDNYPAHLFNDALWSAGVLEHFESVCPSSKNSDGYPFNQAGPGHPSGRGAPSTSTTGESPQRSMVTHLCCGVCLPVTGRCS